MIQELQKGILSDVIFRENIEHLIEFNFDEDIFTDIAYKSIFKEMQNCHFDNIPISSIELCNRLGKGYENLILDISATIPIIPSEHNRRLLNEYSKKEKIKSKLREITHNIDSIDINDTESKLFNLTEALKKDESAPLFETFTYNEDEVCKTKFIGEDYLKIPLNTVSLLISDGGGGKTWVALNSAIREALKGKKVFAWLTEDSKEVLNNRLHSLMTTIYNNEDIELVKKNLKITDSVPFDVIDNFGNVTADTNKFLNAMNNYDYVIIDPLINFFTGDENNSVDVRKFMKPFLNWTRKSDEKVLLFLHHTPDGKKKARGAGDFRNAVRSLYYLDKHQQGNNNYRTVELLKDNYNVGKRLFDIQILSSKKPASQKKEKQSKKVTIDL